MAAGALLHSLIHNHPFHNGNKRTALVAMLVFLDKNHWSLRVESDDELFEFVLAVGSHSIVTGEPGRAAPADREVITIANWLHRRLRPTSAGTRAFKFHDLRTLLRKYDCHFEQARKGNRMNIRRGSLSTQVWYGGEGRDVRPGTVPKIRRELQLDEEHGYDSEMFYNADERLPGFIMRYRQVLDRLAKT
jgi:death-on-curing protein